MATIKLNNVSIATETAGAAALTVPSIQQTDAQNISGTKASHEMFMGKTFTLTGDLTVNDNLVFANLTGGGADITITDDGNGRTITTGSAGTLEGGEFLGTVPPPTDISTMTSGAIASGITGSPALNLSNATYQVGGVLQIVFGSAIVSSGSSATTGTMGGAITNPRPTHNQGITAGTQSFTPRLATSKIIVQTNNIFVCESSNVSDHSHLFLQDNTASTVLSHFSMYACINDGGGSEHGGVLNLNHAFDSWGTSTRTLEFRIGHDGGGANAFKWNPYYASGSRNTTETGQFHWTLTEIAQ